MANQLSTDPKLETLSGFNGYPEYLCHLIHPTQRENLIFASNSIARGQGLSYGDAAINTTGVVISTKHLNRIISFDAEAGILTVEAGITLDQICELIISKGWCLPVMPGTALVSVGGAVAADVHGKNHYHTGSFGQHVIWFELIGADGVKIRCSAEENKELFWATIGGMGLTGFIALVALKLKPIVTPLMQVKTDIVYNLEETLNLLEARALQYEYSVAWIDARHKRLRGVVMSAQHAEENALVSQSIGNIEHKTKRFFKAPISLVNSWTTTIFNQFYYWLKKQKLKDEVVHYKTYFFPLDKIKNWTQIYGKNKFIQYQCLFPYENASFAIQKLFDIFKQNKIVCSLVVLKRFGAGNQAPLSFPKAGITIAIDIPLSNSLFSALNQVDEWVVSQGGRVYLAKDSRLSRQMFLHMYPEYVNWIKIKNFVDPDNRFRSAMSDRLMENNR